MKSLKYLKNLKKYSNFKQNELTLYIFDEFFLLMKINHKIKENIISVFIIIKIFLIFNKKQLIKLIQTHQKSVANFQYYPAMLKYILG